MTRKILIDTDTASDDAAALAMGLRSEELDICAITTVRGNVSAEQAALNALMTMEVCQTRHVPVYTGANAPWKREPLPFGGIHGRDGMGDSQLICPTTRPHPERADQIIASLAQRFPGELEILTIGPVTNLARAISDQTESMSQVKRIYTMGSGGFGPGNITPHAEFNVYSDPEAFEILVWSGIPMMIIGFDVCTTGTFFTRHDLQKMAYSSSPLMRFLFQSTLTLRKFMKEKQGVSGISLPDAVAMGVLLKEELVLEKQRCIPLVRTVLDERYGMVQWEQDSRSPIEVCRKIDGKAFKELFFTILT